MAGPGPARSPAGSTPLPARAGSTRAASGRDAFRDQLEQLEVELGERSSQPPALDVQDSRHAASPRKRHGRHCRLSELFEGALARFAELSAAQRSDRLSVAKDRLDRREHRIETLVEGFERRKAPGDLEAGSISDRKECGEAADRPRELERLREQRAPERDRGSGIQIPARLRAPGAPSGALLLERLDVGIANLLVAGKKSAERDPVAALKRHLGNAGPVDERPVLASKIHQDPRAAGPLEESMPRRDARILETDVTFRLPPRKLAAPLVPHERARGPMAGKDREL